MRGRTFVLIHGAFRGGWSFARLAPLLERRGHRALAPSLPGAGEHSSFGGPVDLEGYARFVARYLELFDLTDVVLLGHSQGGLVITAASELCHHRIGDLVFLDAPVPVDGERGIDLLAPALAGVAMPALSREQVLSPRPVVPGPGLTEEDAAWINARTTPAPVAPSLDPVKCSDARALALPRHYFFCRLTPATYPCAHGRARLDAEGTGYGWIEAGHDAPVTHPHLVAEALASIASLRPAA